MDVMTIACPRPLRALTAWVSIVLAIPFGPFSRGEPTRGQPPPATATGRGALFNYRLLVNSFRKAPENPPERVAEDLKVLVPDDIRPWTTISLVLSASGYNSLDGDTPLEFAKRFDRQGYRFLVEIADPN